MKTTITRLNHIIDSSRVKYFMTFRKVEASRGLDNDNAHIRRQALGLGVMYSWTSYVHITLPQSTI
jgi:hypothetical protein